MGLEEVVVAMAGVAMEVVVEAEVPALDQETVKKEDQRLIATRAPFEGKTQTGGERTRFLPRASTNFYKSFLKNHFSKIKHLSVDYMQVNHHPILTGGSRSKDKYSESPQSGTIQSRSSYKVPAGVEQRNR